MSRLTPSKHLPVKVDAIEAYLQREYGPGARVLTVSELGQSTQVGLKDYGYGKPLLVTYRLSASGAEQKLVIRTMTADPFGHDRRADRVGAMVQDFDTFQGMPRHIQPSDVGTFSEEGTLVSMGTGEGFLVTEYVDGDLYAEDLGRLAHEQEPTERDIARAEALADYLAKVHALHGAPDRWTRAIRDTIGSGEGIFGLCDSYPPDHPVASFKRLEAIEKACIEWRWKLRHHADRACRTHSDFHPFNILFRDGTDFTALDCSRGAVGEPADDVSCLSINYLFFALSNGHTGFEGALRVLWDRFWSRYLSQSGDRDVLEMVAPFFAWRGLVVASPVWYPNISDEVRETIFVFIERLLSGHPFDPSQVDELLE